MILNTEGPGQPRVLKGRLPSMPLMVRLSTFCLEDYANEHALGTSISVFGMIGRNSQKPNTTLSFAVDGSFVSSIEIPTDGNEHFHRRFFSSPTLQDGSHKLDIILTDVTSKDVFLDYLIYEASPASTLTESSRLLVLNTSPQLTYSQGWSTHLSGLRSGLLETAVSLNSSVEGAADVGATVAFNFTGASSAIAVSFKTVISAQEVGLRCAGCWSAPSRVPLPHIPWTEAHWSMFRCHPLTQTSSMLPPTLSLLDGHLMKSEITHSSSRP